MEAYKKLVRTPKNHEIKIKIPRHIPQNQLVEVILILRKQPADFEKKVEDLRAAENDEMFQSDLREISEDFENIDLKEWEE